MKYGYDKRGELVAVLQDSQETFALRLTKSGVVDVWTASRVEKPGEGKLEDTATSDMEAKKKADTKAKKK
jgi:hypothetical protein